MQPLNVSFGIYAFLPMGWLFMAFIILGEAFLMSRYLVRNKFDKKTYLSATVSNIVSGALGSSSAPETIPLQENIPGDLDCKCLQLYPWGGLNHPALYLND